MTDRLKQPLNQQNDIQLLFQSTPSAKRKIISDTDDATLEIGKSDTYGAKRTDVKVFGATSAVYEHWDASANTKYNVGFTDVDGTSSLTVSNGDGTTSLTPVKQINGTTKATGSILLSVSNATDDATVAPSLQFLKNGSAALAGNVTLASGEIMGEITASGADGTDFKSPAAQIQFVVDAATGTGDMGGRVVLKTSVDGAEALTEAFRIDNAQRRIGGGVAAQAVNGITASAQDWGTTAATSARVLGCASATDGTAAEFIFAKSGSAAVGGFDGVANGETLGGITWCGANGTNLTNPHARIHAICSAAPGASDAPGAIVFSTTADGTVALTEAVRIIHTGLITTLGATPANVTAAGAGIFKGGLAMTDVANAHIDDGTHGTDTVVHYIGNNTINTAAPSDVRLKTNIEPTKVAALDVLNTLRIVDFDWKDEDRAKSDGRQIGVIAQEVQAFLPEAVFADDKGFLRVKDHFTYHAIKAIQELDAKNKALEARLAKAGL